MAGLRMSATPSVKRKNCALLSARSGKLLLDGFRVWCFDVARVLGGGGSASGLPGLGALGTGLLGLGQAANAAYLGQKSGNFADMAAQNADDAYKAKAGLRAAGISGMGGGTAANNYAPTPVPPAMSAKASI